ncbi:acyl carrier protein [[Brevibacterium] frigoritolerans]|uniref:Acyl carrier protein n=1 Tax=Peribacillus frigoritolerans TaxID=450367 RepID=A0A941FPK3_9BACI|nr:acyl carrier protein [Peribacillus frigoritolerans]
MNSDINGDSDFFQLGGHSITAMKMVSKINKRLDANMKLADLFENPTLKMLNHKIFPEMSTPQEMKRRSFHLSWKRHFGSLINKSNR